MRRDDRGLVRRSCTAGGGPRRRRTLATRGHVDLDELDRWVRVATGLRPHHQPRRDHRGLDRTTDGTPALVRVHWPLRPTTAAVTHYPAAAATIVRISPRVQRRWHDTRREDYEQRQGVSAVRRRFARSR